MTFLRIWGLSKGVNSMETLLNCKIVRGGTAMNEDQVERLVLLRGGGLR